MDECKCCSGTNKTLYVKTGLYEEQLPIVVGANTQVIGDGLRSAKVAPAAGNSTASGLTNTPNSRADMFRVRNGVTFSGFTFKVCVVLWVLLIVLVFKDQILLTVLTRSGVIFALDPGTESVDTSTHITSKSPFIQNCTHIGSGSVGIKIDGSLHNAGSIVQFLLTTLHKFLITELVYGH